jgi:hypothetical protein
VSLACHEERSVSNMNIAWHCVIHGLHIMYSFHKIYIRTYHRQNPVNFMVHTTVRTLYTSRYVHRQNPVHFMVRTPSEPCTLHVTYLSQNPVRFMVHTTVRTLYTSRYVPQPESCTLYGKYHITLYTSWYIPQSESCTLHGTYHRTL